jgi:hypothetical protein
MEKTEAAEGPFAGEFIEVPMGDAAIHKLRKAENAALIASPMLEIIAPVNFVSNLSRADRVMRAIQLLILPGGGIIDGFEVRKDGRTRNCFS